MIFVLISQIQWRIFAFVYKGTEYENERPQSQEVDLGTPVGMCKENVSLFCFNGFDVR